MKMRKSERQVTDSKRQIEIMQACKVCRVGFIDEGKVYIVPLNYGFEAEDGKFTLYFHGNAKGRKMDLAERETYAAFEMDTNYQVISADMACNHTSLFASIIGTGKVTVLTDYEEKRKAFKHIMIQCTGSDDYPYMEKAIEATGMFKIEVEEISFKEHDGTK